jgi:hypothetical protein
MSGRPMCNSRSRLRAVQTLAMAIAFLAICFTTTALRAQVLYGSITGTVTDKTGAVIPNVTVSIAEQGTGAVRSVQANGVGAYGILNVLPGQYTLTVVKTGSFAGFTQTGIQIEPNRQVRVDVALQPATVSTQITVTEAPAELQTETAEVNHEISQTQLSQLPISSTAGRSYQALYSIIPGAAAVTEKNSTASNPSRAMSVNVNGTSYNGNTTRIDGAVNYYGWLPYLIAYVPPADSIENVGVTTNDFNAEQGQAGGASIKVTTKSGTRDLHGSAWEYYQDAALSARSYTTTYSATPSLPKNLFNEYGFNIGGPVYLPRLLTGRKKLFFFQNFERTTRRQHISGYQTVPDSNMIGGNFSEATSYATLYDPAPTVASSSWIGTINTKLCPTLAYTSGYLNYACRPSFTNEYGETGSNVNTIPAGRLSSASKTMIANLSTIASSIGTPSAALLSSGMANDYFGAATYSYNRNTSDSKITYIPSDNTQIFGKYSIEPFSVTDPQTLGAAGGGTFDGGQPGAASGRIQNVGLGMSHVFTSSVVVDADFGYTRQVSGAQSSIDIADGDYGLSTLGIPGTNGTGANYMGQPYFAIGTLSGSGGVSNGFSSLGNANGGNPFLFRDNQFTGDVNLSWVKSKHSMKYGFTYYHFDLNHFQPTSGSYINNPRGGFAFQGNMSCGVTASASTASCGYTAYNALGDYLLGLPNQYGAGPAVAKASQINNPNSLRWTEFGLYAQDQWNITQKLTLTYGIRYEIYPAPYRDHTGVFILNPALPQSSNVEVGDVNGNPKNAGLDMGHGFVAPRLGIAFRLNDKTVIRTGAGLTSDPDSLRYLRDAYPEDLASNYTSSAVGAIAIDTANGNVPMPLTYGIPIQTVPNYSSGFTSLPVSGSTNSAWMKFRRGYIESWNLFVQRDLGRQFVANLGYVGNHFVRQQAGVSPFNAAPLPSSATPCMPNGQYNTALTGLSGACNFNINQTINWVNCTSSWTACYNTGGITMNGPIFSSNYNGMQAQLTRNAGKNASMGVVYTWSHAFNYEDNGAGTGAGGTAFNYPAYYKMNRATASFDSRQNLQVWGIYALPFGHEQRWANHGFSEVVFGGFSINGQFSHMSGTPFAISANSNTLNASGSTLYGELVSSYKQKSGHNRTFGNTAVSGGKPWFDPSAFANPTEPTASTTANPGNASPVWPNTHRNQFRGSGQSAFNASAFRSFHIYRGSEFQFRFEAFNLFNHALLNNPNTTVPSTANVAAGNYGTFGMITSFGNSRSLQFGGRFNF